MATHDYIISNASGAAVRADLNNALAAIATNNSSATAPTTTYAYQWWADTGSTPTVMKLRNAANSAWITLFQLDGEWSLIPFENGTAAAPSIYFKDSGTDTGLFSPGVDQVGITTGGAVRLTTSTTAFTGTLPWQGQNGTAAAPALSFSGDPNTGIYNVGADNIGVSTNGTLRFDVSTTATTSTLPVVHPLGAVGTPSVTFTGDLNTGIYSPGADSVAITTGGTQRATVDSSGRLLVGTTSAVLSGPNLTPQVALEGTSADTSTLSAFSNSNNTAGAYLLLGKSRGTTVGSNTVVQANDELGGVYFYGADGSTRDQSAAAIIAQVDATPGANDMPGRLVFSTTADGAAGPIERCRIDSSGRLLVGTSTSTNNLRLNQSLAVVTAGSNTYAGIGITGYSGAGGGGGTYPLVEINRSRGTTDGSMTVVASGDRLGEYGFRGADGTNFQTAASIACEVDGTPGANDMPGRLVFSTTADGASSPTERMRISNQGTTTVLPAANLNAIVARARDGASSGGPFLYLGYNSATDITNGTYCYSVATNGNVLNTNGSYTAISDAKLKENIIDASTQWDDLKSIKIRHWNFKEETGHETHRQIGPIAQELETVCPGLVFETPDRDEDGNETGEVTKGVNQSVLYMKAVKALQEAMERIEQLEAEMAEVKAQLS